MCSPKHNSAVNNLKRNLQRRKVGDTPLHRKSTPKVRHPLVTFTHIMLPLRLINTIVCIKSVAATVN